MGPFTPVEQLLPRLMDEGISSATKELDYDWSKENNPYNGVILPYVISTIFLHTALGSMLWLMFKRQFIEKVISNGDNSCTTIINRLKETIFSTRSLWMTYLQIHCVTILTALASTLIIYWIKWDLQFYSKILTILIVDGLVHGYLLQKASMTETTTTSKSSPQ